MVNIASLHMKSALCASLGGHFLHCQARVFVVFDDFVFLTKKESSSSKKIVSRPQLLLNFWSILRYHLCHRGHHVRAGFKGCSVSRSDLLRESGWWGHRKQKNTPRVQLQRLDQVHTPDWKSPWQICILNIFTTSPRWHAFQSAHYLKGFSLSRGPHMLMNVLQTAM